MLEFQQFNNVWDEKMAAFDANAGELVAAMKERHSLELRDFQQRLLAKQPAPKYSKEVCCCAVAAQRLSLSLTALSLPDLTACST